MTISSIGGKPAATIQSLVDMRTSLDDLQRQLSTGQKSATYSGLGFGRGVSVGLHSQLSAITGYDATGDSLMIRLKSAQTALDRISALGTTVKTAMMNSTYGTAGANATQSTAQLSLDEVLGLLNAPAGDHYLFSGRATDKPAVESTDHILNGDGARAGLKQIISERNQADLGASGLGRLTVTTPVLTPETVTLAEDAVSPFGFKIASITSSLTNATIAGPSGTPPEVSVDMSGGIPNAGDTVTFRLNMPDGTTQNLTMTATDTAPPGENQFLIGADGTATATNLSTAMGTSLAKLASTSLSAASAVQASNEFFSADSATPPPRVTGPNFAAATAMTTGSSADTVIWYTGETGTDSARSTAAGRIDPALTVGYGMRANETGIRTIVQNLATLAAMTIPPSDPNSKDLSTALNSRLTASLAGTPGVQSVADIQTDLAGAQVAITAAKDRHQQQNATLSDYLQQIEGVSNEEVGATILTLQTRLQASMQVTSMMYQISLVNYMS